uniref:Uncharacterized protein n=1 Tax=Anopheles darlingi TaxID=43151 RepID=A0A2M4D5Q5_ANODA
MLCYLLRFSVFVFCLTTCFTAIIDLVQNVTHPSFLTYSFHLTDAASTSGSIAQLLLISTLLILFVSFFSLLLCFVSHIHEHTHIYTHIHTRTPLAWTWLSVVLVLLYRCIIVDLIICLHSFLVLSVSLSIVSLVRFSRFCI